MIIVKLQGGLGNQMFQYAAAKGQSKSDEPIYFDHSFLEENCLNGEHFTARSYELNIFKNINVRTAKKWQREIFRSHKFLYRASRRFLSDRMQYVFQQNNEMVSFGGQQQFRILYLDGYFQSQSYFENSQQAVFQDFRFPELDAHNEALKKRIFETKNSISLHIRRGDYEKSTVIAGIHGVLTLEYYQNALEIMCDRHRSPELFVFSDDTEWARSNLETAKIKACYIEHNNGENSWKDLALMTCCNHHIIANSSFSWWGAWLNPNPEKIIIAPKKWYNDPLYNSRAQTMLPDTWITL
ncbi:alpha-1,2-fucosyltransferase [Mucilaginibacter flavidus]|uniref:alpha-1,2-fucosyltransferase n=1 Tax=Mucilaginibacter flavidus TaxID=2949309 RepID=UPI002093608D|nr:alpha-1,2-fucosyltransferase [Mucilaginibacter flavidus]MCO5947663.1 alpha-1,2-fucosyltransferase [Mucilaginibacter flavidus]